MTRTSNHTARLRWKNNIPRIKEGKGKYPKRDKPENTLAFSLAGWSATSPRLFVASRSTHKLLEVFGKP